MKTTANQLSVSTGKAVQFWRKIKGLMQKDLAELLNIERSYVAKIENAHVGISQNSLADFANALGVSPRTIFAGMPSDEELETLLEIYSNRKLDITDKGQHGTGKLCIEHKVASTKFN